MNRLPESGDILLARAQGDADMLRTLLESGKAPDWGLGFHAQQAMEKAIKAVLAKHWIVFPRTHNLDVLVQMLRDHSLSIPPDAERMSPLSPFGAILRYGDTPDPDQPLPDRAWLLPAVTRTLDWATTLCRGSTC